MMNGYQIYNYNNEGKSTYDGCSKTSRKRRRSASLNSRGSGSSRRNEKSYKSVRFHAWLKGAGGSRVPTLKIEFCAF